MHRHTVITNYLTGVKYHFALHGWSFDVFEEPFLKQFVRGVKYPVRAQQAKQEYFFIQNREVSQLCVVFHISYTFREALLLVFYGLLRI